MEGRGAPLPVEPARRCTHIRKLSASFVAGTLWRNGTDMRVRQSGRS
jgi:hypothetical protein